MIPKKVKTCNVNSICRLISGYLHKQKTLYGVIKAKYFKQLRYWKFLQITKDYSKIKKTYNENQQNNKALIVYTSGTAEYIKETYNNRQNLFKHLPVTVVDLKVLINYENNKNESLQVLHSLTNNFPPWPCMEEDSMLIMIYQCDRLLIINMCVDPSPRSVANDSCKQFGNALKINIVYKESENCAHTTLKHPAPKGNSL